jgi:ABC-type sugar transport system permease subunit
MSTAESTLQIKARKRVSIEKKKQRGYWLFLIPFLIGFFMLFLGIYLNSIVYSFSTLQMNGSEGFTLTLVGFQNYTKIWSLTEFQSNLVSSVTEMLLNIPMVILYSLFIAVILSQNIKGRGVFRAIFFIPVILATGFMTKADMNSALTEQTWTALGDTVQATGTVANGMFDALDLQKYLMNLSFSPALSKYVISAVTGIFDIVNISGVQMLIFLSGLQSISPSIYESADIDGATAWETFWLITFPLISPIILVNVIYTIIDSFTRSDNAMMVLINEQSFKNNGMGLGAAMSWSYFLIVAVCIVIIAAIINGFIYYQQREEG